MIFPNRRPRSLTGPACRDCRETGTARTLLATALLTLTMSLGPGLARAAVSIDGVTLNGGVTEIPGSVTRPAGTTDRGSTALVRPLPDASGHIPTWADEQRATFHRMVMDNRASRLHGDAIYQQAVAQQAALFAEAALDPAAGIEARRWAAMGAAITLDTHQGGEHGTLLHDPGVERARVRLADRMVEVSQAMVTHGDPDADLGLVNAAAYFANPSTPWFNPTLAARLERQQAAVLLPAGVNGHGRGRAVAAGLANDPSNGRRSLLTAQALVRCAQDGGCGTDDRALLDAFVTSVGSDDPEVGGTATARYLERTGGVAAVVMTTGRARGEGAVPAHVPARPATSAATVAVSDVLF